MKIFNSLGSNYDLNFAIRHLMSGNNKKYKDDLTNFLEKKYDGNATLVYKGREAIRLSLRSSGLNGGQVGICGFTCYAVYDAIVKEGFNPVYLDIEKEDLNFSFQALVDAYKKNPEIEIIMIQNTLGFPCEMERIANFCHEKSIIFN